MNRMKQWMMAVTLLFCGASVFTACNSDDNAVDSINSNESEMADYAILFYGYGGGNLDYDILNNIKQFYAADPASYDKVKIAVQYKFSSQEEFEQLLMIYDPDNFDDPQEKAEAAEYLEEMKSWIAKWQNRCCYTFRFTVNPEKTVEQQMVADNVHGCNNDHIATADSLLAFIDWAAKACPAKHYVLLLSDHGAGYMPNEDLPYTPQNTTRSFFIDNNKKEQLTVNALKYAIANASIKPQVVYFDACLMNCFEYQFELKDYTDYIVASSFVVPGWGGDYTVLTNKLAGCNEDTESALKEYNKACVEQWDKNFGDETVESFTDMTVVRTRGLDAFGQKVRSFTDKLLQVYQSSDEKRSAVNTATANALKVYRDKPFYDLFIYATMLAAKAPELEDLYFEMKKSYDDECLVAHQTCAYLRAQGINGSVLLGWEGQYEDIYWQYDKGSWVFSESAVFKPDGKVELYIEEAETEVNDVQRWASTFADTYEQTAFDKATGWSRWIKINKQRPPTMSVFTEGYNANEPRKKPRFN